MADTHWYAEEGLTTGADDGTSPADAFRTVEQLVEYNGFILANRNRGWIRRGLTSIMTSIWAPSDDGGPSTPIQFIGWPRPSIPNTVITQADWTNGSTTVDNIVGITCIRTQHQGRYTVGPDGCQYLITRVVDTNTVIIDREYAGTTVTGTSGLFQIEADEDYDDRPTEGTSAGWDSDAIDLPIIDANNGSYYAYFSNDQWYELRNVELRDSTSGLGILRTNASTLNVMGCLFHQDQNNHCGYFTNATIVYLNRCIFEGSGSGGAQTGIYAISSHIIVDGVSIYGMGDNGLRLLNYSTVSGRGLTLGVEIANGDDEIYISRGSNLSLVDTKLRGENGYVHYLGETPSGFVNIENYQKTLGINKTWFNGGEYTSTEISGEVPNKKLSDIVLKITPNVLNRKTLTKEQRIRIPLGIINMDAGSQSVYFWIYNDLGVIINVDDPEANIYLEAEYVDSYSDVTAYTRTKVNSIEQDIDPAGGFGTTLIVNGNMELDDSSWPSDGTPIVNERSSEQAHSLTYSRKLVVNSQYDGIDQTFTTVNGTPYKVVAWVYGDGTNKIFIRIDNTTFTYANPVTATAGDIYPAEWTKVLFYFIGDTDLSPEIQFLAANGMTDGTWYIDDVSVEPLTPDADDWASLSVILNPAIESLVRFNLVVSVYSLGDFFVDPQTVIT